MRQSCPARHFTLLFSVVVMTAMTFPALARGDAAADINGASSDGRPTGAVFFTSLSLDKDITFNTSASTGDSVIIKGVITPDPADVGHSADIFVIDRVGDKITVRDVDGNYQPLTGGMAGLIPAEENRVQTDAVPVDVFSGKLGNAGRHRIYLGYQRSDSAVLVYSPRAAKFEIDENSAEVMVPEEGTVNEEITFQVNSSPAEDVTYTWDFGDGSRADGSSVIHTYNEVNRYLVSMTRGDSREVNYYHVNIGRAYEDTVYPRYSASAMVPEMVTRDFAWNDCDPEWETYRSKYFRLYVESSVSDQVLDRDITRILLFYDYMFDIYSEIFGWEYMHSAEAYDIYLCDDIPGGGTGTGGSFFGEDLVSKLIDRDYVSAIDFEGLLHEMIHLWDFRGGTWLNSRDTAHALTSGMEPIINDALGMGGNFSAVIGEQQVGELEPDYIFNHYYRIGLKRYLAHPELDWYTYNSDEFLNLEFEKLPLPENKEHMLVPGTLLMSLYKMHGLAGLEAVFAELEKTMLANPDWRNPDVGYKDLDKFQRVQNFEDAAARALQVDVSDYFDYWKYPAVDDSVTGRYPKSDKIVDHDGDGFSPLQGDFDDADPSVYPYAPELADGKDNNLDGLVDEHVYVEAGDIDDLNVSFPFAVQGSISSLEDEDSFTFTVPQSGYVILDIYSKDSDTAVEYTPGSGNLASVFMGLAWMDGQPVFPVIHDAISAPEVLGAWYLNAGVHTLTLNTKMEEEDDRNPNPGNYEVQVFTNTHVPVNTIETVLDIVYPGKYTPPRSELPVVGAAGGS